jgi:membrane-bound metal-dependent hydrolase YbcI (DUF457 family)
MTTVGHSLTGLSIAVLTLPRGRSLLWYLLVGHFFIFFANVPDFPFPGWGHADYHISHSIFVTVLLASLLALLLLWPTFDARVGTKIMLAWSLAWFSHMPLDAMYSHGIGIAVFWPFSDAHLSMPIPWFDTIRWPPRSEHNLRVFRTEALVFGLVLVSCVVIRSMSRSRNTAVSR